MPKSKFIVRIGTIQGKILLIRGEKVIIDKDLAEAYGIPTRRLNEQVKRNSNRFPADFIFQLTPEEKARVVANCDHLESLKYSKTLPYAFTEHGAIMAASVLNSTKAIEMSIYVVRAFIQQRRSILENKELSGKMDSLERKLTGHDEQIMVLIEAIKQLMAPKLPPKKRRIGFHPDD